MLIHAPYTRIVKARAKHSPFAKNPDLAIIGERISGLTKILAKDFQLLGKKINKEWQVIASQSAITDSNRDPPVSCVISANSEVFTPYVCGFNRNLISLLLGNDMTDFGRHIPAGAQNFDQHCG